MATEQKPMSGWTKAGIGLGGITAFLGRRILSAYYVRGVQYATDAYIRFIGGAVFAMFVLLGLNFAFMMIGMKGAQAYLAIFGTLIALYYMFAPKILVPLTTIAGGVRAGAPGDQVNIHLARDGLKDVANMAGVTLFWIQFYVLATMVIGFEHYPIIFQLLHLPIVMALMLLMSGKVAVNPKVYVVAWWFTIGLIVLGVGAVAVGREQLRPLWAEFTANSGARAEAETKADAIRKADEHYAKWYKENVVVNDRGILVLITKDMEGRPNGAIHAQPFIDGAKKQRNEAIRAITRRDAGASGSKPGKLPEWVPAWARDWGPIQWMTGSAVGLILMHVILWSPFMALLAWLGFKVGKKDDDTKTVVAKTTTTESGVGLGTIMLVLLAIGGYFAYQHWNDPSKIIPATPLLPSISTLTAGNFVAEYTTKNAHLLMPQHHWHGKPVTLAQGSYVAEKMESTLVFDQDPSFNLRLQGICVNTGHTGVPRTCAGQYDAGQGYVGAYHGEWGAGGEYFRIKMYAEDRISAVSHPIAEVLIYGKQ